MAIPLAIRSLSQRRPGCDQSGGIAAVLLSNAGQVEPQAGVAHLPTGRTGVGMPPGLAGLIRQPMRPNRHRRSRLGPGLSLSGQATWKRRAAAVRSMAGQSLSALADRRHTRTPITSVHSVTTVGPMMVRISERVVGLPVRAWMSPASTDPIPAENAAHPSHRG
jgi:hypothetical protein